MAGGFYERLDTAREAYLGPRRILADKCFARWERLRAERRYPAADKLLQRCKSVGVEFHFASRKVFWGFSTKIFQRFAKALAAKDQPSKANS